MSGPGFAFTRPERIALLSRITAALVPLKLDRLPPDKEGHTKAARFDFATAVHAQRIVDSLEYVERDRLKYLAGKQGQSEPGEAG